MTTETTLQELEDEAAELKAQLDLVEERIKALRCSQAEFQIGDVVEALRRGRNRGWQPAIVRKIDVSNAWTFYWVSWRKADGQWSKTSNRVYSDVRKPQGETTEVHVDI